MEFRCQTCSINVICKDDIKTCVDLWLQIGTGGPFLLCVCVCVFWGWGASPVQVKDPIVLTREVHPTQLFTLNTCS